MLNGYDASGWSGNIDFSAARSAGLRFAWFRTGRGEPDGATDAQGIDLKWIHNKNGSIGSGTTTGGYWRFFPNQSMINQVLKFSINLKQQPGMLPPLLDIEQTGGLSRKALTDWVISCAKAIEREIKVKPVIYTYKNFLDTNLEAWRLNTWEICLAWQTSSIWADYRSIFWQHKLDTTVPWASGKVDLQRFALNTLERHVIDNDLLYYIDEHGMLHGPRVYDKRLPESGTQGFQPNHICIVHTMVGYLLGTDSMFRGSNQSESTLGIGGKYDPVDLDGAIFQWMGFSERSDANGAANAYAASIETSDGGGNRYKELWSSNQAESIAQVCAAWCLKYNRPPKLIPRARSTERGLAYHRQGVVGYKLPGDDTWSSASGKICPGFERSSQFTNFVIPRVAEILGSTGGHKPEDNDMQLTDVVGLRPDGSAFTVQDVLGNSYLGQFSLLFGKGRPLGDVIPGGSSTTLDAVWKQAGGIKTVLDRMDALHRELQDLTNLVLRMAGQPNWKDLETTTWAELASQSWDSLISE